MSITDKELATFNRVQAILDYAQGKEITVHDVVREFKVTKSCARHNLHRLEKLNLMSARIGIVQAPIMNGGFRNVKGCLFTALTDSIDKDAYFAATEKMEDKHKVGFGSTYNFIAPNLPSAKVTIPKGRKSNMKPSEEKHGGSGGYTTGWYGGTSSIVSANVRI